MLKVWDEEDQAKAEDGGSLHDICRLFCRLANIFSKGFLAALSYEQGVVLAAGVREYDSYFKLK